MNKMNNFLDNFLENILGQRWIVSTWISFKLLNMLLKGNLLAKTEKKESCK